MATTRQGTGSTVEAVTTVAYEQRKRRLRLLIDLEHDGVISDMIRKSAPTGNRSRSSYISQIQSGHRPFTEPAARRIEIECGKPIGWLDGKPDKTMDALVEASSLRVGRLRAYIEAEFDGSQAKFCADRKPGPRRQQLIGDLLSGTRFLSEKHARALEADCGIPGGLLDQE